MPRKNDPVDFVLTHHQLAWLLTCANKFAMCEDPEANIQYSIGHDTFCVFTNFPREIRLQWEVKTAHLSIKRRTYTVTWRNENHGIANPVGIVCMGYLLVCAAQMPKMEWNVGTDYGNSCRCVFMSKVGDAFRGNP